jgi:TPR repeat protein
MRATGKLFLILMFVAAVGACGESSSPPSKQEAAPPAENRLAQLQKQADSGDADAQFDLGVMYRDGKGVPKDATKAMEWLQKAAALGNAKAHLYVGGLYYDGKDVPKDLAKAVEWFQKAAALGNADAQYILGDMYHGGEGMPKNTAKAIEWYQKAAAQGNANAQYSLGLIYDNGEGVPKDAAKAVEWYRKAAAQGNADAQYNLARMYALGEGVPKDAVKATEWTQKAAAHGHADAQYRLARTYYLGEGMPKNTAKAIEWLQKAAAQGNAAAQYSLGLMYYNGEGVPKDAAKAVEWWQKAAAQGYAKAQGVLGWMYHDGEGVPKDRVLAYAWFNLAAAQGKEPAKKIRDLITLSSAQRAEAERLSSNWKPGQVLQRESESAASAGNAASGSGTLAKKGTGTAFVVSTEGHAVTNHHVVAGCKELRVQGRSESIPLITRDAVSDLALLKMPGETRAAAALAPDPASLRQGQDIVVFGFPLDSVLSSGGNLTPGVVSAITGLGNNSNQIQITAPIQPGSSGSPVMDKKGHVVGVVSMKLSDAAMAKHTGSLPQNVNFAISGQTLKAFLDANRVPYKTGSSFFTWEKSLANLGDEARKWTTVVECWK